MKKVRSRQFSVTFVLFWGAVFATFVSATKAGEAPRLERLDPEAKTVVFLGEGDSMGPYLPCGSLVFLEETAFHALQRGDWIAYRAEDGVIVTHALRVRSGNGWYAQGLANRRVDRDWVHAGNYLGRVYAVMPPRAEAPSGVNLAKR